MKKHNIVTFALCFLLPLSCTYPNYHMQLKTEPTIKNTFILQKNYQQVYREAITRGLKCHFESSEIHSNLFYDAKNGYITFYTAGGVPICTIDLEALSDKETKITTYFLDYDMPPMKQTYFDVERWIKQDSDECQPAKK